MEPSFFNRDLSWLQFNGRVLDEAGDESLPIMERLRYLAIFSSNLDEFSRVRTPTLFTIDNLNNKTKRKIGYEERAVVASTVTEVISEQLAKFGGLLNKEILPKLEEAGYVLYYYRPFSQQHLQEVKKLFLHKILSFIQPQLLDSRGSLPFAPPNGQPYFLVELKDANDKNSFAWVNVPSDKMPRIIELSEQDGKKHFCFIDDIVRENMHHIFPAQQVQNIYSIKFNRDAELHLDEEFYGDVLAKVAKVVKKRDLGDPSRFLYEQGMPLKLQMYVANIYHLSRAEMVEGRRYHNLKDLFQLPIKEAALNFDHYRAAELALNYEESIFQQLQQKDFLLHFPYQTTGPLLRFFNEAAIDPQVTTLYISLYRVAQDSQVVNALISAAKNGKDVYVFVELKARFDESNNIMWSRRMKQAGIQVIYSIPKLKVHSKIALVGRKEGHHHKYYSLISTGNFNESTASVYTDHTLFTADTAISADLLHLFKLLAARMPADLCKTYHPQKLLVSSFNMIPALEQLLQEEMAKAQNGTPALVRLKMNSLEESGMITKLYEASNAGVKIELVIRGICCLVPGVAGQSENIVVKRIVGRYLEHSRIFIFGAGEDAKVFMGSADWMTRNLYRRVEVITPIEQQDLKQQLIKYFSLQWSDSVKADVLQPDGTYQKVHDAVRVNAQELFKTSFQK